MEQVKQFVYLTENWLYQSERKDESGLVFFSLFSANPRTVTEVKVPIVRAHRKDYAISRNVFHFKIIQQLFAKDKRNNHLKIPADENIRDKNCNVRSPKQSTSGIRETDYNPNYAFLGVTIE